jgi:DNA repair exonuclease SbcCD ATPase subunit
MDEIDILMDQLQGTMPDDVYEIAEFDIDEMVRVNLNLRDKIKDISMIVKEAITKARELKKSIHTHRDPPKDAEVKDKRSQINQYQNAVNLCKSYIATLNNKIDSMADVERLDRANNKIKKLSKDIRKLEDHKVKLKERLNNQIKTINNLYSDPEFKEKVSKTYEEINKAKEVYDKCKLEKKSLKEKQKLISEDYVKTNSDYRKLKDRKIALQNNISQQKLFKKDFDLIDECEALKKRNENYEKMVTNKQIKMIDKILLKEMK